jgi:hypothetical protein
MFSKIIYWQRILNTYVLKGDNNLSFWHGNPSINSLANYSKLGHYYMNFENKAQYNGDLDNNGIPLLNYKGDIGLQYNPIAISQWSLGNYNLWKKKNDKDAFRKFLLGADWLLNNYSKNKFNQYVWVHTFNWVYKEELVSPWYSGLAQGQGLSVLCRAYTETGNNQYLKLSKKIYNSFLEDVYNGGVTFKDKNNNIWIEEYIMKKKPTHILNGFIWGLWGIYDYWLITNDNKVYQLFKQYVKTIKENLQRYDIGYWSLYELSDLKIKMRASRFYHKLHIVQLNILSEMSKEKVFGEVAKKWSSYEDKKLNILKTTLMKIIFKILYY